MYVFFVTSPQIFSARWNSALYESNIQEGSPSEHIAVREYDPAGMSRRLNTAEPNPDEKASNKVISEDRANFLATPRRCMAVSARLAVISGEHAAERACRSQRCHDCR